MNEKTFAQEIKDEKTTGRWICLWPNGTRSVVFDAFTVEDAIEVLDEIGSAEPYMLHPISASPSFIDFIPEVNTDMGEEECVFYIAEEVSSDLKWEVSEPTETIVGLSPNEYMDGATVDRPVQVKKLGKNLVGRQTAK